MIGLSVYAPLRSPCSLQQASYLRKHRQLVLEPTRTRRPLSLCSIRAPTCASYLAPQKACVCMVSQCIPCSPASVVILGSRRAGLTSLPLAWPETPCALFTVVHHRLSAATGIRRTATWPTARRDMSSRRRACAPVSGPFFSLLFFLATRSSRPPDSPWGNARSPR